MPLAQTVDASSTTPSCTQRAALAGLAVAGAATLIGAPVASTASAAAPAGQGTGGKNKIAFVLSHEQFSTQQLVEFGVAAERAGFDGMWTSDHIQPWQENHGHAESELSLWDTWRDWPVSADPQAHVKHVEGLWDAGATHVFVHSGNNDQMRFIDFYGKQVIPKLAR